MVALVGNKEIGDKTNKIISKLAEANNLKGVIDVDAENRVSQRSEGTRRRRKRILITTLAKSTAPSARVTRHS